MKKITIAIDGFSSCGKSTMAKDLAREIGYIYIDSGAMSYIFPTEPGNGTPGHISERSQCREKDSYNGSVFPRQPHCRSRLCT